MNRPIFETDDERLSFVTTIYQHPEFTGGNTNVLDNVPDNVLDNVRISKQEIRQGKIIDIIRRNGEITTDFLAAEFNVSHKTIQRDLASLKAQGRVNRIGSASNGFWEVIK